VPVHLVLAEAVDRIRPAAEHAGIPVEVDEPDPRLAVLGDRRQLVSAVYNLLDNAVKHSDAGSPVHLRAGTDGRYVDLTVQGPGPRPAVLGVRRQLVSAVYKLLDNAGQYADAGAPVPLRAGTDGRYVDLTVQDRGIGTPARDLERVFERFYRVDQARSRQTGG